MHDESVNFLEQLRPNGPWLLVAIHPTEKTHDGSNLIKATTTHNADETRKFIDEYNGKWNLYFSTNPARRDMSKKPQKTDISQVEFQFADLDPKDDESPEQAKARYLAGLETYPLPATAIIRHHRLRQRHYGALAFGQAN
jgi:hypothetical protein